LKASRLTILWGGLCLWAVVGGCGGQADPVADLIRDLSRYPEFSLILDDMRVEDGFFADYFLRCKIITASGHRTAGQDTLVYRERLSNEMEVPKAVFARYEHYLGMVIASKSLDGKTTGASQAHPPGYNHVGNSHYGHWGAGGFWQFYGQYALMSQLMGGWRVGRSDYDDYQRRSSRGQAYYGPTQNGRSTFGTRGSQTQTTRPKFYQRQAQRQSAGRTNFSGKAQSRMGRGSTSWGSGSSGGK
jgi:hypothetical protein